MNNNGTCDDVDECETGRNSCWAGAHCTNTVGSYECSCPEGFIGNGRQCQDKDECSTEQHNCHELGQCRNTVGGFECVCNEGTLGNGTYCEEFPPPLMNLARTLSLEQEDDDYGIQCALNDFYRPWVIPNPSCLQPSCEAQLDIINAWHTTTPRMNRRAAKLYGDTKDWWGWSGTITVPHEFVDDFAVILRFPREVVRGSFETWNLQMRSFALGDGGYDLLLTPKTNREPKQASSKYELLHPNQFQIVAQRLKSPYFPSIVFWNTTKIDRECFGEETAANMDIMDRRVRREERINTLDDVRKLVLINDEIRRLRRL